MCNYYFCFFSISNVTSHLTTEQYWISLDGMAANFNITNVWISLKMHLLLINYSLMHISYDHRVALLSATLRTYQKAACDSDQVIIACPRGTSISIEFAQYNNFENKGRCRTIFNNNSSMCMCVLLIFELFSEERIKLCHLDEFFTLISSIYVAV